MNKNDVTLVIFTCEGREHLLHNTWNSFKQACDHSFAKVILAIDGPVSEIASNHIQPDVIVKSPVRKGYIHNILQALKMIDTPYFFWLEDDWKFDAPADLQSLIRLLDEHADWAQIIYSKFGPLDAEMKQKPLGGDLYEAIYGFSANPCICKTAIVKDGFENLLKVPKGDKLGVDGFENSLTRFIADLGKINVIQDPVDHSMISHEGYLESTPRNWHMTNSLGQKTKEHLLTIPVPSFGRRILMACKMVLLFPVLIIKQFMSDKIYELCFRILASEKMLRKK
ncbi:MAG TPA: glycosyltransferase [Mucilaginibacter sp.]|jgi:hypothetical protein|nr:glycosyltransferase [Mucilaginibacter sp.]